METQELAITDQEQPKRSPVAVNDNGVKLTSFDEMGRFCVAIAKSRLAPKGFETPEAIMVAVQYGMEIGLGPMQALQSIAVINGRPSLWGDALPALIMSRPDFVDMTENFNDTEATCSIQRKGRQIVTRKFSVDDAKKAGLWGKSGPWTQYPKRMLQMRSRSWAIRDAYPDALRGIGIAEEVRDIPQRETVEAPKLMLPGEVAE